MPKKKTITNMYELGLLYGDVLTYKDDPTITAKVVSKNQVEYQGKEYSLSTLVFKLKHPAVKYNGKLPMQYNGWQYWLFNGVSIDSRRAAHKKHQTIIKMKSITEKKKLDKKP
jgi:hypothetical protein